MVPEAPLERTEAGLVPGGDGWFVLNAQEAHWRDRPERGSRFRSKARQPFRRSGHLFVLGPGEPIGMYHWEADQEDFLVVSGEGLLLVEGEERPLRQWDFVHCPAGTNHIIVGAGASRASCRGRRARASGRAGWGGYTVDAAALRHGAGVEQDTTDATEAYARFRRRRHALRRLAAVAHSRHAVTASSAAPPPL